MSLSPNEKYPGATEADPNYKDSKFKDNNPSTTNNGSPLKALDRNEQLALQEAMMNAAGFDYNGVVDTPQNSQMFNAYKAALSNGANLLPNHNFIIASPDDSQPAPSATPTSYPPGYEIFSGVFANETTGILNLTYIDGRVSFSGGSFYMPVANTGGIERVTEFAASVADFDGKPRTRGVSYALVGDEYRVTVGVDALEDANANATPLGSVKFEQGSVATGHEVQSAKGQIYTFNTVAEMVAQCPLGSEAETGKTKWKRKSTNNVSLSDFHALGDVFSSSLSIKGDGSSLDESLVSDQISSASNAGVRCVFDVEGTYSPISLVNGSVVFVSVDMTLKGNPSTTPQGITDTLWNIIGVDGFEIKWAQNVVMKSEDHGVYQEFSHAIKIRDGSRNGYVGPHAADGFDGDGLFLLNVANTIIDNPRALRVGRSGISCISQLLNVTINNPYHLGFNSKVGAINLAAIDIEPNEFGEMSLTINKPTGFGERQTAVGLNIYLELIERNAVNHGRYNVTINDPDYVEYNKTYQFARSTWNLTTDLAPRGQVSIVRPISTNHTDNAILIESWQRKGGIGLNIVDPTIILTKSANGSISSDSGNVIVITRNQAVWVDDTPIGNINITGIDINDVSGYMHKSYCKIRYGRFPNAITFKSVADRNTAVPLIDYPEHVSTILSESSVSAMNPPKRAFTVSTTLPDDAMLFMNTNEGSAVGTTAFTLPIIPIGSSVAVANLVGGSTINVLPPTNTSIGTLPANDPYPIVNSTQVVFFERITSGRWFVK